MVRTNFDASNVRANFDACIVRANFNASIATHKKQLLLVALAHPNGSLDGVGVALKVKGRQSNDDITC